MGDGSAVVIGDRLSGYPVNADLGRAAGSHEGLVERVLGVAGVVVAGDTGPCLGRGLPPAEGALKCVVETALVLGAGYEAVDTVEEA